MTERFNPFVSKFPEETVSKERWGIDPTNIEIVRDSRKIVPNIVEGIRDCLDHNKFETNYGGDEGCSPIEWIKFNGDRFKATFAFEDFKMFVNKIADFTISKLE